jgi:hypothetical protein
MQESDARIKQYEEEIRRIRAVMQQSVQEQQNLIKVCNDKKLEVQQVLEFFGQEKVARGRQATRRSCTIPSGPASETVRLLKKGRTNMGHVQTSG